ncbi:hypothetical protein CAEBREN_22954 [Caenorhabditis brenneri]|uniref:GH18 domain-containing protein n=1 Tax=Caenorhabditis brenneri TaxID=135651 RepID=G0M8S9_CAEBE|nr:hypothetical protein CAEBREN_22954 [Caenorhabditis brenneri]
MADATNTGAGESDSMIMSSENANDAPKPKKSIKMFQFFVMCLALIIGLSLMSFGASRFVNFNVEKSIVRFTMGNAPIIYEPARDCGKRITAWSHLGSPVRLTKQQLSMLTHVILYPMYIQENGTLTFEDEEQKKNFAKYVSMAKKSNVKALMSTDGHYETKNIAAVTANAEKRKVLVDSIILLVNEYQLDGVDVYWKYPKTKEDFLNLIALCKDLKEVFDQYSRRIILSHLIPPASITANTGYVNLQKKVIEIVDFVNVDVNGNYGYWIKDREHLVGPAAPLYSGHGVGWNVNVNTIMQKFSCLMNSSEKLNMMVNIDSFRWDNVIRPVNDTETLWMTADPENGKYTGRWIWWRDLNSKGYDVKNASWNQESRTPYIWNSEKREYLSFENEISLQEKMKYASEKNIGGVTFWELRSDDDSNTLLEVVKSKFGCVGADRTIVKYECEEV